MNTVWILLMVASVLFSFLNGRLDAFTKSIFEGAKSAVEVSLFLLGIVSIWLGITKIIEDSGLIHRLSGIFQYPDSLASLISAVIMGSAETTFYVLAVYLGAVGIKRTRYLVPVCILADLVGIIIAISIVKLFFHLG